MSTYHPEEPQVFPAQSPQNVMLKTILWELNFEFISQLPLNIAVGVPQFAGSGLEPRASPGILPRGKNQTLMKSAFHSVAYTPPPPALKPGP